VFGKHYSNKMMQIRPLSTEKQDPK